MEEDEEEDGREDLDDVAGLRLEEEEGLILFLMVDVLGAMLKDVRSVRASQTSGFGRNPGTIAFNRYTGFCRKRGFPVMAVFEPKMRIFQVQKTNSCRGFAGVKNCEEVGKSGKAESKFGEVPKVMHVMEK